jgi:hypothetical protein
MLFSISKRETDMRGEQTKDYFNLKAVLIRQGWNEKAASTEAYKRIWPARGK